MSCVRIVTEGDQSSDLPVAIDSRSLPCDFTYGSSMVLNTKSSRVYVSSITVDTQGRFVADEKGCFFNSTTSDGERIFSMSRDIIVDDILDGRG